MSHLIKHKIILVLIICLLCSVKTILACDCRFISTEDAVKKSSVVFSGKVVGFEYRKGIPNWSMDTRAKETGIQVDYETLVVKVQVDQRWKGELTAEMFLLTDSTRNADGSSLRSSCDYNFQKGETYLIFATGEENEYRTSACIRTRKLTEANDDMKILGEGKKLLESKEEPNNSMNVRRSLSFYTSAGIGC